MRTPIDPALAPEFMKTQHKNLKTRSRFYSATLNVYTRCAAFHGGEEAKKKRNKKKK